jgi:hypothetical protein
MDGHSKLKIGICKQPLLGQQLGQFEAEFFLVAHAVTTVRFEPELLPVIGSESQVQWL